ncbi:hypothetical protein AB1Y20_004570 [Prymnesium parvum]|uniref:Uncharacterized protein n=1 Tax=Prymnesium parvum TaxID=97485 RepID=A0AB34IYU4_PRYPA|mmetsp:Transcript_5447/g.13934  ORF Transcript_5447/g.13934 Transcript_5447/m.13934 type:complete len:234 (-) Transcript_5447:183-884(-)
MSARRSGPPAHQNKTKWVPNRADKHNSLQKVVNALEIDHVCHKCKEVLEWKRAYGKYKPLKQPGKCVGCGQKTVTEAYHALCSKCSSARKACPKCMTSAAVEFSSKERKMEEEAQEFQEAMLWMNERERRNTQRKLERGEDVTGILATVQARKEAAQSAKGVGADSAADAIRAAAERKRVQGGEIVPSSERIDAKEPVPAGTPAKGTSPAAAAAVSTDSTMPLVEMAGAMYFY